jgi:hypothetical protein
VNRECVGSSFEVRDLDGFEEQLSKLIRLCSYGCDNFVKKSVAMFLSWTISCLYDANK